MFSPQYEQYDTYARAVYGVEVEPLSKRILFIAIKPKDYDNSQDESAGQAATRIDCAVAFELFASRIIHRHFPLK